MNNTKNAEILHKEITGTLFSPSFNPAAQVCSLSNGLLLGMPEISFVSLTYAPYLGLTPIHYDDCFELFWLNSHSDSTEYLVRDKLLRINPGEFIFIPMGCAHRIATVSPSTTAHIINFTYKFAADVCADVFFDCAYLYPWLHGGDVQKCVLPVPHEYHDIIDRTLARTRDIQKALLRLFLEKDSSMLDKYTADIASNFSTVIDIAAKVFYSRCTEKEMKAFKKYRPPLLSAIAFMEKNFMTQMKLTDVCDAAGLKASWLCALFREVIGMTVTEYLNFIRIRHGRFLLINTTYPITEIAKMCGYNNIYHFDRAFKAHTGCSPKIYRSEYLIDSQVEQ